MGDLSVEGNLVRLSQHRDKARRLLPWASTVVAPLDSGYVLIQPTNTERSVCGASQSILIDL